MGKEIKTTENTITTDSTLSKLYNESARVGAENTGGSSPLLKIHTAGRSSTNVLLNGKSPQDGFFFYKPTQQEFEEINCHILYIGKGFRAEGLNKPHQFNQLFAGIITNDGANLPFVMYMTGKKLRALWDFGEEAGKYTRQKPIAIPMFALTVKLTTKKEKNSFGESWVVKFEIVKNADGTPALVLDEGQFVFLRDSVESAKDMIAAVIDAKATDDPDEETTTETATVIEEEPFKKQLTENVPAKEIPF